jgi:hypothetical protein
METQENTSAEKVARRPRKKRGDEPAVEQRAHRINELFEQAAARRGYKKETRKFRKWYARGLVIRGEFIRWRMIERSRIRKQPLTKEELAEPYNVVTRRKWKAAYIPTSTLVFFIDADYQSESRFEELKGGPFEGRIGELLAACERAAALAIAARNKDAERSRRRAERAAQALRMDILADREETRWSKFRAEANAWREATILREFLDGVARKMGELAERPRRVDTWLGWAKSRIDFHDPMTREAQALFTTLIAKPRLLPDYDLEFGEEEDGDF